MTENPDIDKQVSADTDLISRRAELFRSKLIADFNLLDTIKETGGTTDAPKYDTEELLGEHSGS